jgi:hypothetical protein
MQISFSPRFSSMSVELIILASKEIYQFSESRIKAYANIFMFKERLY